MASFMGGVQRFIYTVLIYLVGIGIMTPLRLIRYRGRYRHIWQSFGFADISKRHTGGICVHAVSVGETVAAQGLIRALLQNQDQQPLLLTATTLTGADRVRDFYGDSVGFSFFPVDSTGAVSRFLNRARPAVMVLMETEIWPNLIYQCNRRKIPVMVFNARLSQRSAGKYALVRPLIAATLGRVDCIAAQSAADARRFESLGADKQKLVVTGNLKFDQQLDDSDRRMAQQLRDEWGNRPTLVAASTHKWEEVLIIHAARQLWQQFPDLLVVIVPRHPERFAGVRLLCERMGEKPVLRSTKQQPAADTRILLVDTMGELSVIFGAVDIAFIGGSLEDIGGHNVLEAAVWGVPIVIGPHYWNFEVAVHRLRDAGALQIVPETDIDLLAQKLAGWLAQPQAMKAAGQAGAEVVAANRGALTKTLQLLREFSPKTAASTARD